MGPEVTESWVVAKVTDNRARAPSAREGKREQAVELYYRAKRASAERAASVEDLFPAVSELVALMEGAEYGDDLKDGRCRLCAPDHD